MDKSYADECALLNFQEPSRAFPEMNYEEVFHLYQINPEKPLPIKKIIEALERERKLLESYIPKHEKNKTEALPRHHSPRNLWDNLKA